jgi:Mrp family chromosome partitioning ATPase
VKRAKALLNNVKANFIGVILNDVRPEQMYGSYYYYYYYHYYYGDDGEKKRKKRHRGKEKFEVKSE